MKISATVMAHPKRKEQARALLEQLQQYPFTECSITWDRDNVEWHTGKRALQAGLDGADWHIVIQDDAILTPYFYQNLENAIKGLPQRSLFSLYTGTARPLADRVKKAVENSPDGSWLQFRQLLWGVGIAIPADHIQPMLEFVEDIELQYDNKVGEFYCRQGMPVYYCLPSLVDHDDDLGSLIPGHGVLPGRRVAHRLANRHIAWTSEERFI